jgi:hypothetical protein
MRELEETRREILCAVKIQSGSPLASSMAAF